MRLVPRPDTLPIPSPAEVKERAFRLFLSTGLTPAMRLKQEICGGKVAPVPLKERTEELFNKEYRCVEVPSLTHHEGACYVSDFFFNGGPLVEFTRKEVDSIFKMVGKRMPIVEIAKKFKVDPIYISFALTGGALKPIELLVLEAMIGLGRMRKDEDLLKKASRYVVGICNTRELMHRIMLRYGIADESFFRKAEKEKKEQEKMTAKKKVIKGKVSKPRLVVDTMKLHDGGTVFVKPVKRPTTKTKPIKPSKAKNEIKLLPPVKRVKMAAKKPAKSMKKVAKTRGTK